MKNTSIISDLADNLSDILENSHEKYNRNTFATIVDRLRSPLQVMIMGEFSVGKSTFINAMLGQEVAISSPIPTTAVITKFVYGSKDRILVYFNDGKKQEYTITEFNKLTVEDNGRFKEMHSRIKYVERQLPNELLKKYTFIDSPGRNAIVDKHEEITRDFVENADAMLWLFSVDQMGGQAEKNVLQSFSKRLKPIAIVNKVDLVNEDDELDELIEALKINFNDDIVSVVPISADWALQGILTDNKQMVEAGNLNMVYEEMNHYIDLNASYLKVQKLIQDFAPIITEYTQSFNNYNREIFNSSKKQYASYVTKLTNMVHKNDFINEKFNNIILLITDVIGSRELPESNTYYTTIRDCVEKIKNNFFDLIGNTLYNAIHGSAEAQYEYANSLGKCNKAGYWYSKAGEQDYLHAQQALYKNYTNKGYWYEKAAKLGDIYAILQIAFSYYNGVNDVAQDMKKAVYWLEQAVKYEQKDVEIAKYYLAYLYKNGIVVVQDYKKAYDLANYSLKKDYIPAIGLVAELMYYGYGIAQDKIEAFLLWRKGGFNKEIQKYFVSDNYDLHRKIAEGFCDDKAEYNRAAKEFSESYFWYDLDFNHNNNVDSAYRCGKILEKEQQWNNAMEWHKVAAENGYIESMKSAGDICFYQYNQQLSSMIYYCRGMIRGNGYCASKVLGYITKRSAQVFAIYAVLSLMIHTVNINAYSERNDEITKDNKTFIEIKSALDEVKNDYISGAYKVSSENDSIVNKFSYNINKLQKISSEVIEKDNKFAEKYEKVISLDKYFLLSDYVKNNYFQLVDSNVTDLYNHDYDNVLSRMENDEERLKEERIAKEKAADDARKEELKKKREIEERNAKKALISKFSLGNIELGDSLDYVEHNYGPTKKVTKTDSRIIYNYDDIKVYTLNGIVTGIVSDGSRLTTPDGIHEGSDFSKVKEAYGKEDYISDYEGLTLHEYCVTDNVGKKIIMRFAVNKKNKVDYISIRRDQ